MVDVIPGHFRGCLLDRSITMKTVVLCMLIVIANCMPLSVLASDKEHIDNCIRLVNANRNTTDVNDTVSNCRVIRNSHEASCLETMAAGFTRYETGNDSVYDGIDSNHIFACSLFERDSSVRCLDGILILRLPTVGDIVACAEK